MATDDRLDGDETVLAKDGAKGSTPRKRSSLFIYLIIAIVMVAAGYFAGMKFLKSSDSASADSSAESKKSEEKQDAKEPTEMFMMQDIIVNPSGTGGTRFLSVSIGFEVKSPATLQLFEKREPVIKDALLTILGSKTLEQLSDVKEKEITRFQIKKRVEQLLNTKDLAAVYFTDFVLQ